MTHTLTRSQTVVAWDGSEPARAALDWSLARNNDGELNLVRILDRTVSSADYFTEESATVRAREVLKDDADRVSAKFPDLTVHADLRSGDPITELRALSGADTLVVVGTHRRRGSTLRYEWSMGARLAGSANGPIAIIPEGDNKPHSGIVVGVDGSAASNAAVDFAAEEADRTGQELYAIHAWQEPLVWRDTTEPDAWFLQTLETSHRRILDESLLAVARRFPSLVIRASLVRGAPQSALLDAARGAALLVVGDHGQKGISKLLLGSVSHSIVLNIQSPMVVIPAPSA
ncbi:Nucleotide-binding universal stress protein, UspA family [Cryobacterium flavum]|uniref:Universal stress protein n=1 Tax=Cryobacterium flavum TaxID=1424659 RepID=A0A4R8UZH3_9MICO|nr:MULTISPECIES: universal stress protein [Cryobacterium]TFB73887.1 universal stress protein [Cryobacterium flavum]SDN41359.1 Nucleotide-binding universal stress protein, UspA family [Cryobacterium flavum]